MERLTSDSRAIKSEYSRWTMAPFVFAMDQHYIIEHMRANLISPSDLHASLLLSTRIRSFVFINSFSSCIVLGDPSWVNEILALRVTRFSSKSPSFFFFKSTSGSLKTRIETRKREIMVDPEERLRFLGNDGHIS